MPKDKEFAEYTFNLGDGSNFSWSTLNDGLPDDLPLDLVSDDDGLHIEESCDEANEVYHKALTKIKELEAKIEVYKEVIKLIAK